MIALHERIRADFEARILGGELAPGDRLPVEQALMQRYGCSRMTVHKALSALAAAGLVQRRKRAGTFVAQPRMHSMILDVPDIGQQVLERGQVYAWRPLTRCIRPADDADERLLAGGGALMQLDGLHLADGQAFAVECRLVAIDAVPGIVDIAADEAPGSWLLRQIPWTEAETRISARSAGAEARWFGVPETTPCLCVERRTWRGAERITTVRQLFHGDAHDMVARFGPRSSVGAHRP